MVKNSTKQMSNIKPTKEALLLQAELANVGVESTLQYWDGHKHVDLFVPSAKLYIEIDGLAHWLKPTQIISDFKRDHYSDTDGFNTFRVPSYVVLTNTNELVKAISEVIKSE